MLTDTERQVVANAAENYPVGCGISFFSHKIAESYQKTIKELLANPEAIKFG